MRRFIVRIIVAAVAVLAFLGGVLLYQKISRPPVADQPRAHRVSCVNNLKQLGVAFRTWAGDNHGKFCFEISTNEGGTYELRTPDKDGFDKNPSVHLRIMSNEIWTTKILVCPKDALNKAAKDFPNLSLENITYHLRTSITNIGGKEILMICPIDGNILYSDGTVKGENTDDNKDGRRPMPVPELPHAR
jgi:hypothetical protein